MASEQHTDTNLFFRRGTAQTTRLLPALLPEYVRVDERKLSDLLAFTAAYSKTIKFYTSKNEVEGTWESIFTQDISVLLAIIISTNLEGIESKHQKYVQLVSHSFQSDKGNYVNGDKFTNIRNIFEQTIEIAYTINNWYVRVSSLSMIQSNLEDNVALELQNIIESKLTEPLQTLINYDLGTGLPSALGKSIGLNYDDFDSIWQVEKMSFSPFNIYAGTSVNQKMEDGLIELRLLYRAFYNVLSYIVIHFEKYFTLSITQKSNHKPDIGLFISFLKLYKHAQNDLNQLAVNHLHFYYKDILKQQKKEYHPDEVHVCVQLANHIDSYNLKKGTLLSAGKTKEGKEIVYSITEDVEINKAQIESIKTVFISKYAKVQTGSYELVTGIYAAPVANSKDGAGTPFEYKNTEWASFGEEQAYRSREAPTMVNGELGFAIASPVFFLSEGEREVSITLHFKKETTHIYEKLIKDISDNNKISLEEAFFEVFPYGKDKNISIELSGSKGWITVNPSKVKIQTPETPMDEYGEVIEGESGWSPNTLIINFVLTPEISSIIAFNQRKHKGAKYVTRYPVCKILLNNDIEPYCYSFLKDLKINFIDIEVDVHKVKNLTLYNDLGQIDSTQPFQVFGPNPIVGSYLLVGNDEVFKKQLIDLSFDFEWQNAPRSYSEFESYYKEYQLNIHSDLYRINLTALSKNEFYPFEDDDTLEYSLFSANPDYMGDDSGQQIKRCAIKNIDVSKLQIQANPKLEPITQFNNQTRTGFFKLELSGPQEAFGHDHYPKVFTDTVTYNATHKDEERSIPNQPYTPVMKSLCLNYKARTSIMVGKTNSVEQIFHIHPFGTENTFSKGVMKNELLLPQYDDDGYMYLGISNIKAPEPISILFQLTVSETKGHTIYKLPEVEWSFLSRNRWIPFKDSLRLSDTTHGFTQTGIVKLDFPRKISARNNILQTGLYWLRVAVKGDTSILCNAISVQTQAISASWTNTLESSERLRKVLPPQSIQQLLSPISAIRKLQQPYESFGGKAKENNQEFYTRISERLRHKGRAVTHWDYERIVLEYFYAIFQAKCLSYSSHAEEIEPGNIVLVVVPQRSRSLKIMTPRTNFKMLQSVQDYLKNYTSPFVKLRVRNPEYEYIRIICNVKFAKGKNNGQTLIHLEEDIKKFICPWLYEDSASLDIGGSISEGVIQNFIKALPYVKFVTKFSILHFMKNEEEGIYTVQDTAKEKTLVSLIQAKPWAVILPDKDHKITLIEEEIEQAPMEIDETNILFQDKTYIINVLKEGMKISRRGLHDKMKMSKKKKAEQYVLTIKI